MKPFPRSLPLTGHPSEIVAALEAHFGDDANYGIYLGSDDMEDALLFPDGTETAICSNYAKQVYREMHGHAPIKIIGFSVDENPSSAIAQMAGGHDFAVFNDRYIVDGWLKNVEGLADRAVFDLNSEEDKLTISQLYGSTTCFFQNHELECDALRRKTITNEDAMSKNDQSSNTETGLDQQSSFGAETIAKATGLAYFKARYPDRTWSAEAIEYEGGHYTALSFVDAETDTNIFDPLATWDDDDIQKDRYGLSVEDAAEMRKINIPHRLSSTPYINLDEVLAEVRKLLIERPSEQCFQDVLASHDFMPKISSDIGNTYALTDSRSGETMHISTANGDLPADWHDEIEVLINDKAGLLNFKWTNEPSQKRRLGPR